MKKTINEELITNLFDYDLVVPTQEDFEQLSAAFIDVTQNGDRCSYINTPAYIQTLAMARQDKQYRIVRILITAVLLKWEAAKELFLQQCIKLGYTKDEIKQIIHIVLINNKSTIGALYDKYSSDMTLDSDADNDSSQTANSTNTAANATTPATSSTTTNNITIENTAGSGVYRIICYDAQYNPPARRSWIVGKKDLNNATYHVALRERADPEWSCQPIFDSVDQAKNFIQQIIALKPTKSDMSKFKYKITDNFSYASRVMLDNPVPINTICGPCYISRNSRYCKESLKEFVEKHRELNPKLWDNEKLKPEVAEKINLIVNEFLESLAEDEISIKVKDIVIIGSNCSYNYTKDSDLDVHIIAEHIDAPENLYDKIYSSYRSIFNKKLDIEFYDIPVELYVESEDTPTVSNGCYSVLNKTWIKKPTLTAIPEIDKDAFNKELKIWEDRYSNIIKSSEQKLKENWQKKPDITNYEYATSAFDIKDCLFKYYVQVLTSGKYAGAEWGQSIEGIPVKMDGLTVTFVTYDYDNPKFKKAVIHNPEEGYKYSYIIRREVRDISQEDISDPNGYYGKLLTFAKNNLTNIEPITENLKEELHTPQIDDIESFIDDIYELRKAGLQTTGEYGIENLVFKEIRNKGYLDNLRDLRCQLTEKELSLESLKESWMDTEDMIAELEATGHHYKWEKYTPAQIYRIYEWALAEEKNRAVSKKAQEEIAEIEKEVASQPKRKKCQQCGYDLNDNNECPICDLGDTDLLDEELGAVKVRFECPEFGNEQEETLNKGFDVRKINEIKNELSKIAHSQAVVQNNGLFNIYNIKESDIYCIMSQIRKLDYIDWVQESAGKYDFSIIGMPGRLQPRYHNIYGKIKEEHN